MRGDLAGSILGQYQIHERVGGGGMGVVYRGYQPSLERHVAIKVLAANAALDPSFSERFRREALAIARLDHPNILPIYEFGEDDGLPFIAMPLVSGGTLKDQMGSPMEPARVLKICGQIADALDYAHSQQIIHRDVKPANVLIGHGERPILADFGIARLVGQAGGLTGTGMGVGTPEYMSPEQCMSVDVGEPTDQYALAIMVFEMLAGHVPYRGETGLEIVLKQLNEPPPSLHALIPDIPVQVDEVLQRALAKNPQDRFPSCAEFVEQVGRAQHAGGTLVTAPEAEPADGAAPPGAGAASPSVAADELTAAMAGAPAEGVGQPSGVAIAPGGRVGPVPGLAGRLPSLKKWQLVAVGVALVAAAGATAATLARVQTPRPMTGLVNFAIAEFRQVDARGQAGGWEEGPRISESLATRLESELRAIPSLTGVIQVRHEDVGPVQGGTSAERARAASRIAERLKAQLVIYGNLERRDGQQMFAPEFFVSSLAGAEELVGPSQLGKPVRAEAPGGSLAQVIWLSDTLKGRAQALTFFTIGLTYLVLEQPGNAVEFFEKAQAVELWRDDEGKEVVYLFLGTAYRKRNAQGDLERAREAYATAARLNPEYARAYIGLGNVSYEEFVRTGHTDVAKLDEAIAQYERARTAKVRPETAYVDAKVSIALGNAYVVKAQTGQPELFAKAQGEYQRVVDEFDGGRRELRPFAAHAYLGLGILQERGSEDYARAAVYYRRSLDFAGDNKEVETLARTQLNAVEALVK